MITTFMFFILLQFLGIVAYFWWYLKNFHRLESDGAGGLGGLGIALIIIALIIDAILYSNAEPFCNIVLIHLN